MVYLYRSVRVSHRTFLLNTVSIKVTKESITMADEAGEAPAPVEEVEMSVLDALKEVRLAPQVLG